MYTYAIFRIIGIKKAGGASNNWYTIEFLAISNIL